MKTLVLGLGNPILSDDGAGIQVAREIQEIIDRRDITVMETSLGGLGLLDLLTGYDKAVIIDTIQTAGGSAGQVYRLEPEALNTTRYATSPHDVNFATALELGNRLGMALPGQIVIFAIEAVDTTTFSEEFTSDVRKAIPICVEMVIKELEQAHNSVGFSFSP